MKISIIVPVYNVELYIKECFESIAAQIYKGEIECIFVDDCGQDDSVAILEKLIAEYKGPIQFSIVHHEHNKGLSGARNTGIRKASGDYLYFLDSDDSITSDCIEKLTALAEKYPGVDIVQGSTKSKMDWLQLKRDQVPEFSNKFKWIRRTLLKRYVIPMTAWNKLVRRNFLLKHQLYFVEGMVHEDEIWNFMLAKYVHCISFCYEPTYNYRENENGIMSQVKANSKRYLPVVDYMSRHTSTPCLASELECMKDLLQDGGNLALLDTYLANVPCCMRWMHLVLGVKDRVNSTTMFSPVGFLYRVGYKIMVWSMDLLMP